MAITLKSVLAKLKALGDPKVRERSVRSGSSENQFGVPLGAIRQLAKTIKSNHALALELWETGNLDARLLAVLLMNPANLSRKELEQLVKSCCCAQVADWLNAYVVKRHAEREAFRERWMAAANPWIARAGWALTHDRITKTADGLDLKALLDRIEANMAAAAPPAQWTMNFCLAGIGIHHPQFRQRAIAIGEKLGLYRDYPVPKGCTSPFAPIWIQAMVRRQG